MIEDPNLAFPIARMGELVTHGRFGSLAAADLSFMGSITAPGRLVKETAPAAAALLVKDGGDVALPVPRISYYPQKVTRYSGWVATRRLSGSVEPLSAPPGSSNRGG